VVRQNPPVGTKNDIYQNGTTSRARNASWGRNNLKCSEGKNRLDLAFLGAGEKGKCDEKAGGEAVNQGGKGWEEKKKNDNASKTAVEVHRLPQTKCAAMRR